MKLTNNKLAVSLFLITSTLAANAAAAPVQLQMLGQVPAKNVLIEAFCDGGLYFKTRSVTNTAGKHAFNIGLPANTNCRLVVARNTGNVNQQVSVALKLKKAAGQVSSVFKGSAKPVLLGYIPVPANRSLMKRDTNADGVEDAPQVVQLAPAQRNKITLTTLSSDPLDRDRDGIPNLYEDSDRDRIPDRLDNDDDNDGMRDINDADSNNDGQSDNDLDHDGVTNNQDSDDDNDGTADLADNDDDNDGKPDSNDSDDDNDGVGDTDDNSLNLDADNDLDNDGVANNLDNDDDNDGIADANDTDDDSDGMSDLYDDDDDNDGVDDLTDHDRNSDLDGDGTPNSQDNDDD